MIDKLKDFKWVIGAVVAIFLAGGAYAIDRDDLLTQVGANTDYRLIQTYDRLLRKARASGGKLNTRDTVTFCHVAKVLGIGGATVRRLCK